MVCHEPPFLQESETCKQKNFQFEIGIPFGLLGNFSHLYM